MTRFVLILALAPLIAGCARRDGYPSLAPRAVEIGAKAPVIESPLPAPLPSDPARMARLDAAVRLAESSQNAFAAALPKARSAVSAAGARGSDSWNVAQLAVSRLEATRGDTGDALARIDRERVALFEAGPSADDVALNAAHTQALVIDLAQEAEVRALAKRLGGY